MNVLLYQQGGTLYLDKPLEAQPSACTISIKSLGNDDLSEVGSTFDDIDDEDATAEDLSLTLGATTKGAREVAVSATSGEPNPDPFDENYRLLVTTATGRVGWWKVDGRTLDDGDVTQLEFDQQIPFALAVGDLAKSVRCSYAVDWSGVTDTFSGRLQVFWKPTINGVQRTYREVVDIVKQLQSQPATWADVLEMHPSIQHSITNRVKDCESLVRKAWNQVQRKLWKMDVQAHDLVFLGGDDSLADAVIAQTMLNLTHLNIYPASKKDEPKEYQSELRLDIESALGLLTQAYLDANENLSLEAAETSVPLRQAFFRR